MDTSRIKIKIGPHEFEAEGPTELVERQFQTFKELIDLVAQQRTPEPEKKSTEKPINTGENGDEAHVPLEKIMRVDGRVVSLTAVPQTIGDAALLILLGQKDLRGNQSSTGQEIGDGLDQSGQPTSRVDRVLLDAINENAVMKLGLGRSTRYRLTNTGLQKALAVARDLVAQVP